MSDDEITVTISMEALSDLRLAALDGFHREVAEAQRLGTKNLKKMAGSASLQGKRFLHAIQSLDQAIQRAEGEP